MSKLTKAQIKAHAQACEMLKKDRLSDDERDFVFDNWMESARHINSAAGAFFTPHELASSFAIETVGPRILDLCAGIGMLAYAAHWHHSWRGSQITCVEINPDYVEVGRKLLPEARWIVADVFDLPSDLGQFDCVVSNPPFGRVAKAGKGPRYSGAEFEYALIDVASDLADWGAFIIPQGSAPFAYSGEPCFRETKAEKYERFVDQTKIELGPSCGIDCDFARDLWRGTAPKVEVVVADFAEARAARVAARAGEQSDLFGEAA